MTDVLAIPAFLKRSKLGAPASTKQVRKPRAKRIKITLPKIPKPWRDAEKVRVNVCDNWPIKFPSGHRSVLVLRGKTKRGEKVRVREWPCYSGSTFKVDREVFERSVIIGEDD